MKREARERLIVRTKLALKKLEESKDEPASNSQYWRPKGERRHIDAPWLKDGGWSGKLIMIDEPEDWHVRRKRFDAFSQTELGRLYHAYESALTNYWQIGEDAPAVQIMELR